MKRFIFLTFAIIIFCSAISVEAAKKYIAVMPLENISGYNAMNISQIMNEKITISLQGSGRYSVVEREKMDSVLREQGFQNVTADPNTSVQLGKLSGADYLVFGKITYVSAAKNMLSKILPKNAEKGVINGWTAKVEIDIRFVNNETGELVFAENFVGTKGGINETDAVHSACKETAKKIFDKLMSTSVGRVVDIQDSNIYIDQGIESGFRKGDILTVMRETSPIEINGKIVDMKKIPVGKIKIAEVNAEYSICKVVSLQTGMHVKKGDVIRRG